MAYQISKDKLKAKLEKMRFRGNVKGLIKEAEFRKNRTYNFEYKYVISSLSDIQSPRAVKQLIAALNKKELGDSIRGAAVISLGKIGDSKAVEPIIKILDKKTETDDLHKAAAIALGKIGNPQAIESLVNCLKDKNSGVRNAAANSLVEIGKPAIELLIQALENQSLETCKRSAEVLGRIGEPLAVGPLIISLKNGHPQLKDAAMKALVQIGDKRAVEPLIEALEAKSRNAARALGQIGDERAIEPLIEALKEKDIRETAAKALDSLGWVPGKDDQSALYFIVKGEFNKCAEIGEQAVDPLIKELKRDDFLTREQTKKALIEIGEPSVKPLINILNNNAFKNYQLCAVSAEVLEAIGWTPSDDETAAVYYIARNEWDECVKLGPTAVDPLLSALKGKKNEVRISAALTLGKIGDPQAVTPLIAALNEGFPYAAEALGQIGDKRAIDPLIDALKDVFSRSVAAKALESFGWSPNDDEIKAWYYIAKNEWEKCIEIGDPAVAPLIVSLKRQDWEERNVAAKTLAALYRSGNLDQEKNRLLISDHEYLITKGHVDTHEDEWICDFNIKDDRTDIPGTGVDFPL
jgi:HEAT repeat protein